MISILGTVARIAVFHGSRTLEADPVNRQLYCRKILARTKLKGKLPYKTMPYFLSKNFHYNLEDPIIAHCFSWLAMHCAADATKNVIMSWNYHRIPGRQGCIPMENMIQTRKNPSVHLPTTPEAVQLYESQRGRLSRESQFGVDPLCYDEENYERRMRLFAGFALTGEKIFSDIVHGNYLSAYFALERYYNLTIALL